MFRTLAIIPSEFWYIWCTFVHLGFGTPVGTVFLLVHQVFFGTLVSFIVIFGTFGTVGTFCTLRIGSVFSTLGLFLVSFGTLGAHWYT